MFFEPSWLFAYPTGAPDRIRTCDLQGLGIPSSIQLSYGGEQRLAANKSVSTVELKLAHSTRSML